jgi:NADH-quinone oxidoreductase subunit J
MTGVSAEQILFWAFAFFTVLSGTLVIAARNPINSAMALVGTFFFLAGIYVLLLAHTVAVLQVLVYAGAIMVLFLFVIMLLSLTETSLTRAPWTLARILGGAAAVGLLAILVAAIAQVPSGTAQLSGDQLATFGSLKKLGEVLYTTYLLPFEAVSLLLLAAIVGAVVVAKSRI